VLEAAHLRFRPIVMTSMAFMLGVLPLAMASGAGSASQRAIGTGVMGGMVSAVLLSVFFVPVFFVVVRRWFKGSERQRIGSPRALPASPRTDNQNRPNRRGRTDEPAARLTALAQPLLAGCGGCALAPRLRTPAAPVACAASRPPAQAAGTPPRSWTGRLLHRPGAAQAWSRGAGEQPRPAHRRAQHRGRRARSSAAPRRPAADRGRRRRRQPQRRRQRH
jgi:hypothetical protein